MQRCDSEWRFADLTPHPPLNAMQVEYVKRNSIDITVVLSLY